MVRSFEIVPSGFVFYESKDNNVIIHCYALNGSACFNVFPAIVRYLFAKKEEMAFLSQQKQNKTVIWTWVHRNDYKSTKFNQKALVSNFGKWYLNDLCFWSAKKCKSIGMVFSVDCKLVLKFYCENKTRWLRSSFRMFVEVFGGFFVCFFYWGVVVDFVYYIVFCLCLGSCVCVFPKFPVLSDFMMSWFCIFAIMTYSCRTIVCTSRFPFFLLAEVSVSIRGWGWGGGQVNVNAKLLGGSVEIANHKDISWPVLFPHWAV